MAKTCAELITRVRQLVGRTTNLNTTLDLDDIILEALNEAQRQIVRKMPHIIELQVKDTTTLNTVTGQYSYSLSGFTYPIAHISNIWILDGTSSQRLHYLDKNDFDVRWPDVSAVSSGLPKYYTRRGNAIEFNCPISSAYNGKDIRVDYCKWAADFEDTSSSATSEIEKADYGLILFAWAEALRVIAKGNAAMVAIAEERFKTFVQWFNNFKSYHNMQIEELVE